MEYYVFLNIHLLRIPQITPFFFGVILTLEFILCFTARYDQKNRQNGKEIIKNNDILQGTSTEVDIWQISKIVVKRNF